MIRLLQHPAALILLCFALAGTPVSYRGGASDAHPHMFLEFLMNASAGSFVHHHHDDEPSQTDSSSHGHSHTHAGDHDHESADPAPVGDAVDGVDRFAPTLSAFVVGDVSQAAYTLPRHDPPLTGDVATAFHSFGMFPAGLTHAPTAPPPR